MPSMWNGDVQRFFSFLKIVPPGAQSVGVEGGSWRFWLVDSAFASASFCGFKSPSSHFFFIKIKILRRL